MSTRRNCRRNEVRGRKMLKKGKLCLFESFCIPIFTYHYEIELWIWTKAHIDRLVAVEIRFLRIAE
jgi:hypothetical protein